MMAVVGLDRRRQLWRRHVGRRLADAVSVMVGWMGALALVAVAKGIERDLGRWTVVTLVATAATMVFFERAELYRDRPRLPRTERTTRVARAILLGAATTLLFAALADVYIGGWEIVVGAPLVTVLTFVSQGYVHLWTNRTNRPGGGPERVVVIGTGEEARELTDLIREHPEANMELLGVVGDRAVAERHGLASLWLGPADQAGRVMRLHAADSAVVNSTGFRGRQFRQITRELLADGFVVRISSGVSRLYCGRFRMNSLIHEPLLAVEPHQHRDWQRRLKRAADVVGASIVLIVTGPVMLLTALAIKLEDGGPILFRQKRVGVHGVPFLMLKFRSMVPDAEARLGPLTEHNERNGPLFKLTEDPRVTLVGRFIRETSIDELPQLLNVIQGEMSLVGPRPPLPEEQARFDEELHTRFAVRPGITGLWQVEARSNSHFNAYRRLDLHYVENWSLWLDLRILLATAEQVLVSVATVPLKALLSRIDRGASPADGPTSDAWIIDLGVDGGQSAMSGATRDLTVHR